MENDETQTFNRLMHGNANRKIKQSINQLNHSFPSLMVVTIISSILIAIFVVGFVLSRFYSTRREKQKIKQIFPGKCHSISVENLILNENIHIIKSSFSWPETSMFTQNEISSSVSNSSLTKDNQYQSPSLTFSLRWDPTKQSLYVRILNARDLFIHKHHRQPQIIDSYVRIELHSTNLSDPYPSMRTHIIKQNPHPIYDELFEYPNLEEIFNETYSLIFTLITYDTFTRDEIFGEINFPIEANTLDSTEMTFTKTLVLRHQQLNEQQLGEMLVSVCYQPVDSTLTIIVLKASNLPRIGTHRLINPYFKIYMFYKQQRILKKRSTIKRTTQTPIYNESFTFSIPNNDIENIYFDIILFDYDRHMKHEPIGMYSIGKEQTQHWNDICHRQVTKQIAHWYQFQPFNGSIS